MKHVVSYLEFHTIGFMVVSYHMFHTTCFIPQSSCVSYHTEQPTIIEQPTTSGYHPTEQDQEQEQEQEQQQEQRAPLPPPLRSRDPGGPLGASQDVVVGDPYFFQAAWAARPQASVRARAHGYCLPASGVRMWCSLKNPPSCAGATARCAVDGGLVARAQQ